VNPRLHLLIASLSLALPAPAQETNTAPGVAFTNGVAACLVGQYADAARAFRESADHRPAAGTLVNLGIAEWRRGRPGRAILSWEQALWIDPFNPAARDNLNFARQVTEAETPDLAWHEAVSTALSPRAWGWISCSTLWLTVAMLTLPAVLRWRKAGWHQALAALGLGVFLLSIPAQLGIVTRTRIGYILDTKTPLRLTPTQEGEVVTVLPAGAPVRRVRARAQFVFVRTPRGQGWVEESQIGFVCQTSKSR
jgi:hypothetical protein